MSGRMRPEDLGIAPFTPEPESDHGAILVRTASEVGLRVKALTASAEAIVRENAALRGALQRAQGTIQRFGAESLYLKRALTEARQHRAVLFVLGLLLLAVLLAR